MSKKMSERIRKGFKLDPSDFDGQEIYVKHIDSINGKAIQDIIVKYKDDSTAYMFELIRLLVEGKDYEIDLNLEKDREIIEEVIVKNPDRDTRKIMVSILTMILENGNEVYEMTKPINNLNPQLKDKINNSIKKMNTKKPEDMTREELIQQLKNK